MAVRESYSIKSDTVRGTAPGIVKLFVFLSFWLCFGFAIGTITLLQPVRWWVTFSRERGFGDGFEAGGVVILILLLIAVSASLALWASTTWVRTSSILAKLFLPIIAVGVAYIAYTFWINPESMQANMSQEFQTGSQFTFGPYPDQARLSRLRAEGYTAVISLLHPAVVPFEPQLIKREEEAAKVAGIKLIHLPMLPWVSDNAESIERLRQLSADKKGRYYIHCYLGTDRVNVAKRIIEKETGVVAGGSKTGRSFGDLGKFERGEIYELEKDLFLIPYPTDEEFLGYLLGGQIKNVVSLLDSTNPSEKRRLDHELELARNYDIDIHHVDVGLDNYDPEEVVRAVELAKSLERPVAIHAFFTYPKHKSPMAEAIVQAAITGRRPIPPSFFDKPIQGGMVTIVAPNIAFGPEPADQEWAAVLATRGVRSVFYAGLPGTEGERARSLAAQAGLTWTASDDSQAILDSLGHDQGPHYVYGPLGSELGMQAASRYGPALPDATRVRP